jgi:hypothetical protein
MHLGLIYQLRTNSPAFSPPYLLDPHPFLPLKLVTSFLPTYPPYYLPTQHLHNVNDNQNIIQMWVLHLVG